MEKYLKSRFKKFYKKARKKGKHLSEDQINAIIEKLIQDGIESAVNKIKISEPDIDVILLEKRMNELRELLNQFKKKLDARYK